MRNVKSILLTAGVCVAIALLCLFGYIMLQNMCSELFIHWGVEVRKTSNLFPYGFWVTFIRVAIMAPAIEELIFRFLICRGLQLTKMQRVWIIICSAMIFAIYHKSWSQLVYQFIMGIFLAWIFIKTGNIGWTMLIHFINNAFIVTYTYIAGSGDSVFDLYAGSIFLAILLAIATTVAVTFLIIKGIPNAEK